MWCEVIFDTFKSDSVTQHTMITSRTVFAPEIAIGMIAILGIILGVYLFLRGFRLLVRKRLIQNIPSSKVRSASLGEVEISGKAAGPYTILCPLSQSECFYYKATVGDASNRVETLCVPFFVEDETGRVMVDLRGADCQLPASFEEQNYVYNLGECAQHFALRHGFSTGAFVRVSEYCVQASDPLFILGTLVENPNPRNVLAAAFQPGDTASGTDFLSAEAAAAQRAVMLEMMMSIPASGTRIVASAGAQNPTFDLQPPVILKKGPGRIPFVISKSSVKQVVEDLGLKSLLYIWCGPILVLLSVAVLLKSQRLW